MRTQHTINAASQINGGKYELFGTKCCKKNLLKWEKILLDFYLSPLIKVDST